MLEAVWYGSIAALTFIGFVSLVYFLLLHIYKPKNNGRYILFIPESTSNEEIHSLLYGAYLRNIIYGGLISDDVFIFDNNLNDEKKNIIVNLSKDLGGIQFIDADNVLTLFERKEKNGTGFC